MNENNLILVVEDNDFVRMQIVSYLAEATYGILEAADGNEALDHVEAEGKNIRMIVADVRMEPMGGIDFVKTLRGRDIQTPVILVTGDQAPDLLERAGQWGVSAVLMKPVQKDRLLKTVTKTMEAAGRGRG